MLRKTLAWAVLSALASNFALAQTSTSTESAAQATGNIIFTGHVDRGSATVKVKTDSGIDTALADVSGTTIVLPSSTVANLVTGASGGTRKVQIVLEGYNYQTAGAMTYELTLSGNGTNGESLFSNDVTDATGAKNVGVELLYLGTKGTDTGRRLTLGEAVSSGTDFSSGYTGDYTFYFTAGLKAINSSAITSGKVQSTVNVSVVYK